MLLEVGVPQHLSTIPLKGKYTLGVITWGSPTWEQDIWLSIIQFRFWSRDSCRGRGLTFLSLRVRKSYWIMAWGREERDKREERLSGVGTDICDSFLCFRQSWVFSYMIDLSVNTIFYSSNIFVWYWFQPSDDIISWVWKYSTLCNFNFWCLSLFLGVDPSVHLTSFSF